MEVVVPNQQKPMGYKQWAINVFLASLPIIGFILLLVWAFGDNGNIHRQEWAKGRLLIVLIFFVLAMVFIFFLGGMAMLAGIMENA